MSIEITSKFRKLGVVSASEEKTIQDCHLVFASSAVFNSSPSGTISAVDRLGETLLKQRRRLTSHETSF